MDIVFSVMTGKLHMYPCPLMHHRLYSAHVVIPELPGTYIRESVDSLCRDDTDMPMLPYSLQLPERYIKFVSLFR